MILCSNDIEKFDLNCDKLKGQQLVPTVLMPSIAISCQIACCLQHLLFLIVNLMTYE